MYSRFSLSGHSPQRSPSLTWPKIYATTAVNAVVHSLTKGHLSNVTIIS